MKILNGAVCNNKNMTYKKAAHSKTGAAFLWLGDKPV